VYGGLIAYNTDNKYIEDSINRIFDDNTNIIKLDKNYNLEVLLKNKIKSIILDQNCKNYNNFYDIFKKIGVPVVTIGRDGDLFYPFDADELLTVIEKQKLYNPSEKESLKDKFAKYIISYKEKVKNQINEIERLKELKEKKGEYKELSAEKGKIEKKYRDKISKTEKYLYIDANKLKDKKVISFISFKGGVGKTTLIVNFAKKIENNKKGVILIDLEKQYGSSDISSFLKVPILPNIETYTLDESEDSFINNLVSSDYFKFNLLQSPPRPRYFDKKIYSELINKAKENFWTVLINLALNEDEDIYDAVLKKSDTIVIVTTDHLGSLDRIRAFVNNVLKNYNNLNKIVFYNRYLPGSYKPKELMNLIKSDSLVIMKYDEALKKRYRNRKFEPRFSYFDTSINELLNKIWSVNYLDLV